MADIGRLEGSEEAGVDAVPDPRTMVREVHRIRGGALFALAFIAPSVLEPEGRTSHLAQAEAAVAQLGTAFQIVDDLTDFEFDISRRSHNLLVAEVHHRGSDAERGALSDFRDSGRVREGSVESIFEASARRVLRRAEEETRASLERLAELGHWLEPRLASGLVRAIVGLDGVQRMETLAYPG